jgi:DNA ligase-1
MINNKTFELLDLMESINGPGSNTEKLQILKENKEYLLEYFQIACNPFRIFHINKIPKKPKVLKDLPEKDLFDPRHTDFNTLITWLEAQTGSSDEVKDRVCLFLSYLRNYKQAISEAKWCEIAILKKPISGIATKTLNKAGYNIPVFDTQLAETNDGNNLNGTIYPCYIQPKIDGVRVVYINGEYFSRNGKLVPNKNVKKHFNINDNSLVLDGEFYCHGMTFEEIYSIFASEDKDIPEGIKYNLFNVMTPIEWNNQKCRTSYTDQLKIMQEFAKNYDNITVVPAYICGSETEVKAMYEKFLSQGYEGAMVRNIETTYEWRRTRVSEGILVKLKPFDHADCIIKEVYEGTGKNAGMAGGLTIDYNGKVQDCALKLSEEKKIEMWNDKEDYIGKLCRILYTSKTTDGALRFPRYISLRDEK